MTQRTAADLRAECLEVDVIEDTVAEQDTVATADSSGRASVRGFGQKYPETTVPLTVLAGFDWFLFGVDGEYLGAIHAPSLRPVIGRHAPTFLLGGRPTAPLKYSKAEA